MLPKYKDIMELVKKGSTVEAQEKIMELREAALELQVENHELKVKLRQLQEKLTTKQCVIFEKPNYWVISENDMKDGPYCQRCYDSDEKLIRLQGGENDLWGCRKCESNYRGPSYVTPKSRPRSTRVRGL